VHKGICEVKEMGNPQSQSRQSSHRELGKRHIFSILSLLFGLAALAVVLGPTLASTPPYVVGENLVVKEITLFPGFYMKPITFFQYSFFLCFAFALYTPYVRGWFMHVRIGILRGVYIVAWLIALGSGFEVMYHIVLWSASLAAEGLSNPDMVVNPWPRNPYPLNIVYAAKIVVLIFVLALFLIDYVNRIDRARMTQRTVETARNNSNDTAPRTAA